MRRQEGVVRMCVEHIMGTAIVIDVREPAPPEDVVDPAIAAAFDYLRSIDERFSTYKPESEVNQLNRGLLSEHDASPQLSEVLHLCELARQKSDGYFDIRGHRDDGQIDPSGLVKGWSVEGAARFLDAAGVSNYCINAAGDIVARGEAEPGMAWRFGIRDPWDATTIAAAVVIRNESIATSGAYERGDHVMSPLTHRAPEGIASMTVVGPSLTCADTWATAAFAMGVRGVDWIARDVEGYEACAISTDRHLVMSAGFERRLARD